MATRPSSHPQRHVVPSGFTLVELLVVIGIIAVLISVLLPAIAAIRSRVNATKCQDNVRHLVEALNLYAADNEGNYPPNVTSGGGPLWYDAARIGSFINSGTQAKAVEGGIAICPEDSLGQRSYSMNIWASSVVFSSVRNSKWGTLWKSAVPSASRMILIAEAWETKSNKFVLYTDEPFGNRAPTPGMRFGGGTGVNMPAVPIYKHVYSELPYMRHRGWNSSGPAVAPHGRVTIGYADGHVELKSDTDLVDPSTGKSTLDSLWSPWDVEHNN